MIKAILWDNDGVLVDTEVLFFETTRSDFASAGLVLTEQIWGTQYLGEGITSHEIAVSLGGDPGGMARLIDDRNRQYRRILEKQPLIRPRVRETLKALSGRVKMAIVTDCHRDQLRLMHAETGLLDFFEEIITGDDCAPCKPHPAPYLAAMSSLGVNAESCIAVEDSLKGLVSARAAGVRCIVVPTQLTGFLAFPGALSIEQDVSGVLKHIG